MVGEFQAERGVLPGFDYTWCGRWTLEQLHARYAGPAWEALVDKIAARELDPYTAAADLLRL